MVFSDLKLTDFVPEMRLSFEVKTTLFHIVMFGL